MEGLNGAFKSTNGVGLTWYGKICSSEIGT